MSEKDAIEGMLIPNTKATLIYDLKELGLKKGDLVLVHSSLSKLGWVCGREIAVIDALKEVVGETGTIVMPAFSGDNSHPGLWQNPPVSKEWIEIIKEQMPPFHVKRTPLREMGRIAESFCFSEDVLRSNHPQVSFCAWGKDKEIITSVHPLSLGFGKDSPLQRLYDMRAKVLLLGVSYSNCTCLHLSELKLNKPLLKQGAKILKDDKEVWIDFMEYDYDDSNFEALGKDYEKQREVKKRTIGKSICRLIEMKDLCDFGDVWLKEHYKC